MNKIVLRYVLVGLVLFNVVIDSIAFFYDIKTEPVYRAFIRCFGGLTILGIAVCYLVFKKKHVEPVKELFMDASQWKTIDDLYLSFFEAVKAPAWHGKNLDAVRDSIGTGRINGIEVPYCLVLRNYDHLPDHLKEKTDFFIEAISDLAKEGIPVEIRIESSNPPAP
jgi:RNAse (barnase) inhibitor barstar